MDIFDDHGDFEHFSGIDELIEPKDLSAPVNSEYTDDGTLSAPVHSEYSGESALSTPLQNEYADESILSAPVNEILVHQLPKDIQNELIILFTEFQHFITLSVGHLPIF